MLDLLAIPADERAFDALTPKRRIKPGAPIAPPSPVFPRYVEAEEKA